MIAISDNGDWLVSQLTQHYTQTKIGAHSAILEVKIDDRVISFSIKKMGLQEAIQGANRDQLQAIADTMAIGIEQVRKMDPQAQTHQIDIDLDANTIRINNGKAFKIKAVKSGEDAETKEELTQSKSSITTRLNKKVAAKGDIEQVKVNITKEKVHLEKALKELAALYTEDAHDRQKERVQEQRAEMEQRIEELNHHLEEVQNDLNKVSADIDKDKKELANVEQTSLLIDIFSQVQRENFADFFGRPSADPVRNKQ